MELWKDITGFEGFYQISNYGRLKSYRADACGYILQENNAKGGYLAVVLQKDRVHKRYTRIHILVAEHFLPLKTEEKMQVHHRDGNKQNNHVENLQWIAAKDHYQISLKQYPQMLNGMVNYNKQIRPITIQQFTLGGKFITEYVNGKEASDATGECQRNILQVANQEEFSPGRTRKQAGGFIWKLKGGDLICS